MLDVMQLCMSKIAREDVIAYQKTYDVLFSSVSTVSSMQYLLLSPAVPSCDWNSSRYLNHITK